MVQRKQADRQNVHLAMSHYENFPVLSLLLPRNLRQDVANLYAYCRTVDDLGDEAVGDRTALLDQWRQDLLQCWGRQPTHPVLRSLQGTIFKYDLPPEPFLRLIEANRRDQVTNRYDTWDELLDYCTYSANPVGHLYLRLLGITDTRCLTLSDATCTALQLVNFWQDISRDAAMGRIYIPRAELQECGVAEDDVLSGRDTSASAHLLEKLCRRTAPLFEHGLELLHLLPRRHAYNIRLFSLGGMAVLHAVERHKDTALSRRPKLSRAAKWRLALHALSPK